MPNGATSSKGILNQMVPVLFGFSLTVIAAIVASCLKHVEAYESLEGRVMSVEIDSKNSTLDRKDFKELLERNEEALNRINLTLTTSSATIQKDIEQINRRLDKAGL